MCCFFYPSFLIYIFMDANNINFINSAYVPKHAYTESSVGAIPLDDDDGYTLHDEWLTKTHFSNTVGLKDRGVICVIIKIF